ncbi:MAG: hypothetical protein KGZ58_00910 [Ignavibacteriales bacterium]|nr:hypothetical protein [Ignavibacteriales bacterium]
MLNQTFTNEIRNLSTSERLALVEFTFSLLKEDFQQKKSEKQINSFSISTISSRIAAAGESAVQNGASSLPDDFASNHDTYLYGKQES